MSYTGIPVKETRRRDRRLDVIRGLAVITVPTLTSFGYSSSAEIFFLLSGYLVGRIYFPLEKELSFRQISKKSVDRAIKLYFLNVSLFVILGGLVELGSPEFLEFTGYDYVAIKPLSAMWQFVTFQGHTALLGVLQYYCLFLAALPLFVLLVQRSAVGALFLSFVIYAAAQYFPEYNLAGGVFGGDGGWAFNPMAWQFIFYLGAVAGRFDILQTIARMPTRWRYIVVNSFVVLFALTAMHRLGIGRGVLIDPSWADKRGLGLLRVIHVIALLIVLLALLDRWKGWQESRVFRWVETVGVVSLHSFLASIVINYVGAQMWTLVPTSAGYLFIAISSVTALTVFAWLYRRWSRP